MANKQLINARKVAGFKTQKAFADTIFMKHRTYKSYEIGERVPRGKNLKKICVALGLSASVFYPDKEINDER